MIKERMKRYQDLINELDDMIVQKERGLDQANKLNEEFWEDLGAHQKRMEEQYNKLSGIESEEELQAELSDADTIYEAARKYISKYR